MELKPVYSAVIAAGYIAILVSLINAASVFAPEDNLLMPIVMLSLLVFSVALMGFLFFYEPVRLLMEGNRGKAVKHFVTTILIFGAIAFVFAVLSIVISVLG